MSKVVMPVALFTKVSNYEGSNSLLCNSSTLTGYVYRKIYEQFNNSKQTKIFTIARAETIRDSKHAEALSIKRELAPVS